MKLSEFTPEELKQHVETAKARGEHPFQLVIAPIFPHLFPKVHDLAEQLHRELEEKGYIVLLDDRSQKPKNMFAVIDFLGIPHRFVISGRSMEAGVIEYANLMNGEHSKVPQEQIYEFIDGALAKEKRFS